MKHLLIFFCILLSTHLLAKDPLLESIERSISADQSILLKDLKALDKLNLQLILGEKTGIGGGGAVAKSKLVAIILESEVIPVGDITNIKLLAPNASKISEIVAIEYEKTAIPNSAFIGVIVKK